jgi:hypothetical protein
MCWGATPQLPGALCHVLQVLSWRANDKETTHSTFLLEEIIQGQLKVGWRRFFEGWLSRGWTIAQQAYYHTIRSRRNGKRRTIELIKKLWAIAWDLWEHCNGVLHETLNVVSITELHRLNRRVTDAYTTLRSVLLPAHDRHLISVTLPRLLKEDLVYKEVWLRKALAALNSTHQSTCHPYS